MILWVDKNVTTLIWRPVRWPSTEPTLISPAATRWLLGTFNIRNLEWKFRNFWCLKNFGSLLVSKVTGIGSPMQSGHETPGSSDAMHTPDATQQILSEMANQNLRKVKLWYVDKGALLPMTPVDPYLGGNAWKKRLLLIVNPFTHTLESPVWS